MRRNLLAALLILLAIVGLSGAASPNSWGDLWRGALALHGTNAARPANLLTLAYAKAAGMNTTMFFFGNACTSAATTGNSSAAGSWSGCAGGVPGAGDTATIRASDTITVDVNTTWGSNSAGVGPAFSVSSTNVSTFGTLKLGAGVTLTVRGFDTTTNLLGTTAQFALFDASGGTVVADNASDMGSVFKFHGKVTSANGAWTIPAANINWTNASGTMTFSGVAASPYTTTAAGSGKYIHKVQISGNLDPGHISNSTTDGPCVSGTGSNSFTVTAGTSLTTPKATLEAVASNGDYYFDCTTGTIIYQAGSGLFTATYHFNYETHKSFGLLMEDNATGSTASFTGGTSFSWCGSNGAAQTEHLGGCLLFDDKYSPAIDSLRSMTVNNVTFNDCVDAIQVYQDNTQGTASTNANQITLTGNSFIGCHYNLGTFSNGAIAIGSANYIVIDGTGGTWNSFIPPYRVLMRGDVIGLKFTKNTGSAILYTLLPLSNAFASVGGSFVTFNNMRGFSGETDTRMINTGGNPTNGRNTYDSNIFGNGHRIGGLLPYATVTNNKFYQTYHHGIIPSANDEYISNCTVTNNVVYDTAYTGNTPGGITMNYNHMQLIDGCVIGHNTYDAGTRGFMTDDLETGTSLTVNVSFVDSIISNSANAIIDVPNDSSNVSFGAYDLIDYNDLFSNTTTTPTIVQAMFTKGGVNYNTGTRNIAGVKLWNPTGYTLPDATSRSLVEVISGTMGSTGSITLQFNAGTVSANLIVNQRTGSGVGGTTGGGGVLPTLTDTTNPFTTTGTGLRGFQVRIVSGTGAGQAGMIGSNTAGALTVVPYSTTQKWTVAPDTTSVYVVMKSQITVADAAKTVYAGIRIPDISFTVATNTDTAITLTKHNLTLDPQYIAQTGPSARMTPKNAGLSGVASDATFMGALAVGTQGGIRHKVVVQ